MVVFTVFYVIKVFNKGYPRLRRSVVIGILAQQIRDPLPLTSSQLYKLEDP